MPCQPTGEPIWVQAPVGDGRCGLERIFRDLSGSGGKRHRRSDLLAGISWSHGLAAGDQAEGNEHDCRSTAECPLPHGVAP